MADTIAVSSKPKRSKKDGGTPKGSSKKRKHTVVLHQDDASEKNDGAIFDFPLDEEEYSQVPEPSEQPPSKKRRGEDITRELGTKGKELETSKPSALFTPRTGRKWTVSMAIPGSIIANVIKPDHKTLLAGRIARAAAVFCVDEIVIFDDDPSNIPDYVDARYKQKRKSKEDIQAAIEENDEPWQNPDQFLYHVLAYAECPPYIRTDIFGRHTNLSWAGNLPSLDMPHHMKSHEWCRFREGVTIAPAKPPQPLKSKNQKRKSKGDDEQWTYVKCGLPFPVKVPFQIEPHMRLTLKFANQEQPQSWPHLSEQQCEALQVEVVDQSAPREEEGYYWGYQVRRATSLSDVHISCPYVPAGYDVSIGTSERGATLDSILPSAIAPKSRTKAPDVELIPDTFEHLLVVFGGVAGLEPAVASDPEFKSKGLTKETAHEAFDAWVNLVQGQGSRTIRTEEAVEFGLFGLKGYVDSMYE